MKTPVTARGKRDVYLELVRKFPLRPIRSEEQLDRAITVLDSLLDRDDPSPDERDYLDVLSDLVERYETEAYPMPELSDAVMLRHLLEAKGVSQSQAARDAGIAASTLSDVRAGRRMLTRQHIAKLAAYFHVSPEVFSFRV